MIYRISQALLAQAVLCTLITATAWSEEIDSQPFGSQFPRLDSDATGEWWKTKNKKEPRLMVPRDEVLAFAVYTHDRSVLKLTAQLYPLLPDESRTVRLELQRDGQWQCGDWRRSASERFSLLYGDTSLRSAGSHLIKRACWTAAATPSKRYRDSVP